MAEELDPSEEPQKIVDLNSKRPGGGNFDGPVVEPITPGGPANAAPSQPTTPEEEPDELAALRRQTGLNNMFPDDTHARQFAIAFQAVDINEKNIYIDTMLKYAESEPDSHKGMGVATRLEHFEKSDDFKETPLNVKLSDLVKKGTAAEIAKVQKEASMLGGAEAQNGLSRGEGNASVNVAANARKAAENAVQGGANLAGAVGSLVGGVTSALTMPFKKVSEAGVGMYNKVKGDGIPRQEAATQAAVDLGLENYKKTVEKINSLPADTPESKVKRLMETAEKQVKDLTSQIRSQGREGVNNATDDSLTEKQKRLIKTPGEVEEAGESNAKKLSGLTDQLLTAPALQGEGKEQLREKAKAMANEAAEMIRKIIESIKNMFTQANTAKAEGPGQAAPAAAQAPRM